MATSSLPPSTASTSEFDLQRSLSPLDQVTRGTNARSAEHVSKSVRNGNKSLRSKTGCISCRVRRKKCDEIMNEAGACGTCVRLRIKCLGFDTRRPEWMKGKEKEMTESFKTRTRCRRRAVSRDSFDFVNGPFLSIPSLTPEPLMQFSPQSSSHGDFPPPGESFFDSSDQVLLYRERPSSQFLPWRPDNQDVTWSYVEASSTPAVDLIHLFLLGTTLGQYAQDLYHQLLSEPLVHESPQSPIGNGAAKIPRYISRSIGYPLDIESQSLRSANDGIVRDSQDIAPSPQSITIPQLPSSSMIPPMIPDIVRTESNMIKAEDVMGATRPTVWALAKTCQLANEIQARQIYNKELVDECTGLLCKLQVEESQLASLHHNLNSEVIASHSSMIKQVFNAAAQLGVCALMDHDEILSLPTQHAVTLTMSFLRMITTTKQLLAIRSLYLPVFLCGALTKESELRGEVTSILLAYTELGDRFEDSRSILSILEKLWRSVPLDGSPKSVPWRQALAHCSAFLL